jgi:CHAD domain-containing protein
MAKAREVKGLRDDEPFATAAARVVSVRADELLEHSRGVLDTDEAENLHDMRVATRRLRAAMEVFEPCFPRKRFRKALKEVKAIADALGERRDRDVSIAALAEFGAQLSASDRHGVLVLVDSLRDERSLANDRLVPFVDEDRLRKLHKRIGKLAVRAERKAA